MITLRPGQWGWVGAPTRRVRAYVASNGTLWATSPGGGSWWTADVATRATFTTDWGLTRSLAHTDAWYEALRRATTEDERRAAHDGIARCHAWLT